MYDDHKVVSCSQGELKLWNTQDGAFLKDILTNKTDITTVWAVALHTRFCIAAVQGANEAPSLEIFDFFHQDGGSQD